MEEARPRLRIGQIEDLRMRPLQIIDPPQVPVLGGLRRNLRDATGQFDVSFAERRVRPCIEIGARLVEFSIGSVISALAQRHLT